MSTAESRLRRRERAARDEVRLQALRTTVELPRVQAANGILILSGLFLVTGVIERL